MDPPDALHLLDVGAVAIWAGHLEDARQLLKRGMPEHVAKALLADLPLTDVGVAVAVRAERDHRVVDVQAAEALDADHAVELVEHAVDAAGLVHRIARGEEVLSVEAEGDAALVADCPLHDLFFHAVAVMFFVPLPAPAVKGNVHKVSGLFDV